MYALLISIFSYAYNLVFRAGLVKMMMFFALTYIIFEALNFIKSLINVYNFDALTNLFNALPSEIWYFLNIFAFAFGIKLIIGALITRFIIRRLPIVG